MKNNKISLLDVKQALRDGRFRNSLPANMQSDVEKYLNNPGCSCNTGFYRSIIKDCKQQLLAYFPGREVATDEELAKNPETTWKVIHCHKDDLEEKLRMLPPPAGHRNLSMARYEDQITVILYEVVQ